MVTLHLGTFDFEALKELLPQAERCLGVSGSPSEWRFTDGDGWEEWGEGRVRLHPEHIIITTDDSAALMQDVAYVLSEDTSLLQPMTYKNQAGCLAVITKVDERGDATELFVVTDGAARDWIRDLWHKEPEYNTDLIWEHHAWRKRQNLPDVGVVRPDGTIVPRNPEWDTDTWTTRTEEATHIWVEGDGATASHWAEL